MWGSFKISKTNPNTSTTGLSAILMQSYEASGKTEALTAADVAAAEDFSRVFEECVIHYGDTTGKVLTTLYDETQNGASGSGYVSAVALEETSLLNYNQGNPDSHTVQPGETLNAPKQKLVAVYPEGGSMWSDNPVTVLGADWVTPVQREAGEAFAAFVQTKPAQAILPEYGFRPLDESVPLGKLFTATYGVDPEKPAVTAAAPRGRRRLGGDRPVDADPQAVVGARAHRHLGLDGRGHRRRSLEARRRHRGRPGDARPLPVDR